MDVKIYKKFLAEHIYNRKIKQSKKKVNVLKSVKNIKTEKKHKIFIRSIKIKMG